MGFLYHFVRLDTTQQAHRRQLLDSYGQFAQISALIPLLSFQLILFTRFLHRKWKKEYGGRNPLIIRKVHQSPRLSVVFPRHKRRELTTTTTTTSSFTAGRIRWALGEEVARNWGKRLEWLIGAGWTLWLILLTVKDTGDDYLHLTKRFGIIAASQLPLHYLLACKSWSPIQYLTRMSHEELNPYHRFLGRILIAFFSTHALMYLNFFIQSSILANRFRDRDVSLGILAITMLLILGTTTLTKIRNYSYRAFFTLHVVLSISLLPILYFHVSHLRIYILESAAIYVVLILQRNISSTPTLATISDLPSSSLLSVSLQPKAPLKLPKSIPGQHVYLSFPSSADAPLNKLRLNPFTIANLPTKDGNMRLIIRPLSGTTNLLSKLAETHARRQPIPIIIEGPYGSASYWPDLLKSYDRILLVAGGVGATFTLPIYRSLLQNLSQGSPTLSSKFRSIWSVREIADASWGLQYLQEDGVGALLGGFEVFVSSLSDSSGDTADDSIELEDQEPDHLLKVAERVDSGESLHDENNPTFHVKIHKGRPDLKHIVEDVFTNIDETSENEILKVAVLVCGPTEMGRNLRKGVGIWAKRGIDVLWHNEGFSW